MIYYYHETDEAPLTVEAVFNKDNQVMPVAFWAEDSAKYSCRVREICQGSTMKNRGEGIRYKVQAGRIEAFLFRFGDLWYMGIPEEDTAIPNIHQRHGGMNYSGKRIIDERYDNPYKIQVSARAIFHDYGYVEPISFVHENGVEYEIDDVIGSELGVSVKAGIIGRRYKIRVLDRITYLYRDDDLWFMERKTGNNVKVLDIHGQLVI